MSIRIVQALHVDGHAALAQRRPASSEPRWTRGWVGQVRTYWSRGGRNHRWRRRFSLDAGYPLRISWAVSSRSGSYSRLLRFAQVVVANGYRCGTLLLLNVVDHSGRSCGGRWSFWRRRWVRVHWHCRMSTAKRKTNIEWVKFCCCSELCFVYYKYKNWVYCIITMFLQQTFIILKSINDFENIILIARLLKKQLYIFGGQN